MARFLFGMGDTGLASLCWLVGLLACWLVGLLAVRVFVLDCRVFADVFGFALPGE
jgi:hypothetical protein